ncbi:MAG: hypothetical protein Q9O24_04760 [Gammaproteobacteria bacterium]|nr:hypothetical protein [Gammaproteobacteria bacterium]
MKFASKLAVTAAALMTGMSGLMISGEAGAVPAFARQTGMACNTCHFQSFPALTAFGRSFKAGGFTMMGAAPLIEAEGLSLPSTLNVSVITKIRNSWTKDDGATGYTSEMAWPDEAALLIGGRLNADTGYLMELGLGKGSNFLSTKVHFNLAQMGGTQISVIPFSTDGLGVAYGFELLNTGAFRADRPIEDRKAFSANQLLTAGGSPLDGDAGEALGFAAVASASNFFVNASVYTPIFEGDVISKQAIYLRGAYMTDVAGWDVGAGAQIYTGGFDTGSHGAANAETNVFDFQAQGAVGGMPLGLYGSVGSSPKGTAADHNAYNGSLVTDASALGVLAKLSPTAKTAVYGAFSKLDDEDYNMVAGSPVANGADRSVTRVTVGATYKPSQNISWDAYSTTTTTTSTLANRADTSDILLMLQFFAGY